MRRPHFAFAAEKGRPHIAGMLGWFGDLGRLSWGLLYWNSRKSLFRLRGASGAAPCQHPSDSGRAGETGCEACVGWRDKGRFHRLCPLLATSADGRRVCSVDAARVRPFWGRAVLFYCGSLAALAAFCVLGVFAAFQAIGYRVPLYVVAWPPAWHRVQTARAEYFYRVALAAFNAGDVRQSFLALSQVYTLDPSNTNAALLLAQFTQIANPEYSDAIYSGILQRHGANFEATAEVWFRALLARGDFRGVGALASRMLREGGSGVPAWTQGVVFAERMDGDSGDVERLLHGAARIPSQARSVLELASSIRTASPEGRVRMAEMAIGSGATPFEVYMSLSRLIELGAASEVVAFLEGPEGTSLGAYDRESLKLDAYSALHWGVLERREIGYILDAGTSSSAVTLISAHLIRHADAESASALFGILDEKPLPPTVENAGAHMALLCAAGTNGLDSRMKQESELLAKVMGGKFAAWGRVREFFESKAPGKSPAAFLPALAQMQLEVVYAVFLHYHDAAKPAEGSPVPGKPPGGDGDSHA